MLQSMGSQRTKHDLVIEQGLQKQEKELDCYLRTMELPEMLCIELLH